MFLQSRPRRIKLVLAKVQSAAAKAVTRTNLNEQTRQLKTDPDVIAVVPNFSLETYGLPPTKLISIQWALKNQFTPGNDIGYYKVADRIANIRNIPLIGLVDTGFNHSDPRLSHAAWTNPGEIPNNGKDDDANGYIDDVHGYNFTQNNNRLYDPATTFDHGTFVASIIVARPVASNMDVVGIAPRARIVTAVALQSADRHTFSPGMGDLATILQAIRYVVDCGAQVVNLSFGRQVSEEQLAELNRLPIWDELEHKGVILVCAAGNNHSNNDKRPVFPANLPRSNVISVLAVDTAGRLARARDRRTGQWFTFSNYGKRTVHLGAPGTLILGISADKQASLISGTSYAAAMVTSITATVRASHPDWHHRKVIQAVLESARPITTMNHLSASSGILDMQRALEWTP